jgi:transposase
LGDLPAGLPQQCASGCEVDLEEVRRRVQQDTLHRRGHRDDRLYKIRELLRHGSEHLTDRQVAKLNACLDVGDPNYEVTAARSANQQLRQAYATKGSRGRQIAEKVIASFPTCPIPEVARLGRTLRQWRQQVLAYFDTSGVSNTGTEAINLRIEKTGRLAHGFRNFDNYRLRILLVADRTRPTENDPATRNDEEPFWGTRFSVVEKAVTSVENLDHDCAAGGGMGVPWCQRNGT